VQLLLIRHAIAEDPEEFAQSGASDEERPLTELGRRRMVRNVRGLKRAAPRISTLVTSPLVRARQTAEIIARGYDLKQIEEAESLRPGSRLQDFLEWLESHRENELIAAVGHEPHLGTLATWLISGTAEPRVELKKGAGALLEFGSRIEGGAATLLWSIAPGQLRRLGE
jgi:phosphohistidine phosphatase